MTAASTGGAGGTGGMTGTGGRLDPGGSTGSTGGSAGGSGNRDASPDLARPAQDFPTWEYPTFARFDLSVVPRDVTLGPDGNLWFTCSVTSDYVGRLTLDGAETVFALHTANTYSKSITAGPDGNLWVASGVELTQLTPEGTITIHPYSPESLSANADHVVFGSDGALWFTDTYGQRIWRTMTDGTLTVLPRLSNQTVMPTEIVSGPDGALWFTLQGWDRIGRMTTDGATTTFTLPTVESWPSALTVGPDGALWFTERDAGQIGRITTTGTVTEYPIPTPDSSPAGIAAGPDGAVWFIENASRKLGRITGDGVVTEYGIPLSLFCPECAGSSTQEPGTGPQAIVVVANGDVWFSYVYDDHPGAFGRMRLPK